MNTRILAACFVGLSMISAAPFVGLAIARSNAPATTTPAQSPRRTCDGIELVQHERARESSTTLAEITIVGHAPKAKPSVRTGVTTRDLRCYGPWIESAVGGAYRVCE